MMNICLREYKRCGIFNNTTILYKVTVTKYRKTQKQDSFYLINNYYGHNMNA